jgi:hypothetical protein
MQHLVGQVLAGAHAVAQGRRIGGRVGGLLQDLAVDGGYPDEDGRALAGDARDPLRGVGRPFVDDGGLAQVERVHQRCTEHVGPVELARVQHAVVAAEVEPVLHGRLAAQQGALGVQHPFRIAAGA